MGERTELLRRRTTGLLAPCSNPTSQSDWRKGGGQPPPLLSEGRCSTDNARYAPCGSHAGPWRVLRASGVPYATRLLRSNTGRTASNPIDAAALHKAERLIESCERCNSEGAEIPFDNILDRVTASDPSVTDYVLEVPAKCPNCKRDILEKTLIEPA